MFEDERINQKKAKIIKIIMIVSLLFSLFFIVNKLILSFNIVNVILELVIFISSSYFLLYEKIKFNNKENDELQVKNINDYYGNSLKKFLTIIQIGLGISLGINSNFYNSQIPFIYFILTYLVLVITITIFLLKKYKIFLNYSFINYERSKYYSNLFKKMAGIILFTLIPFIIGLGITILLSLNVTYIIYIIIKTVILYLEVISYILISYLIISIIEKEFYEEVDNQNNKNRSRIILFVLMIFILLFQTAISFIVQNLEPSSATGMTLGELVSFFIYSNSFLTTLKSILTGILIAYVIYIFDYYKHKQKALKVMLLVNFWYIVLPIITTFITLYFSDVDSFIMISNIDRIIKYIFIYLNLFSVFLILDFKNSYIINKGFKTFIKISFFVVFLLIIGLLVLIDIKDYIGYVNIVILIYNVLITLCLAFIKKKEEIN